MWYKLELKCVLKPDFPLKNDFLLSRTSKSEFKKPKSSHGTLFNTQAQQYQRSQIIWHIDNRMNSCNFE